MIEAAEADVECPSVSAEDPDALAYEGLGDGEQVACVRRVESGELGFEDLHPLALRFDFGFGLLGRMNDLCGKLGSDRRSEARDQRLGEDLLLVESRPHTEAEFRVVLKE